MNKRFCYALYIIIFVLFVTGTITANDKTPEQLVAKARAQVTSVSIHDVKKMLDTKEDMIILDITDKDEFTKSPIKGAMHISRGSLEFIIEDKIPYKNTKIVVY